MNQTATLADQDPTGLGTEEVTILACGDVGPIHESRSYCTSSTQDLLRTADIRLGQCERLYSQRGVLQVGSGGAHTRLAPEMSTVFSECEFDVVSVASNHSLDWGPEALLDTIALLRSKGIATVGAGENIERAREPVVLSRKGVSVAFLAYCSVLRDGYAAGPKTPGVAPLRARTYYEPMDFQAGVPPRIVTVPFEADVEAMIDDVKNAKAVADKVVMSVHWGIHFIPKMVADYERSIAELAFSHGVDVIFGHHAHLPKAIGLYDGHTCFHGLGNFIMSIPDPSPERIEQMFQDYGVHPDEKRPRLPFGPDARHSLIGRAIFSRDEVRRVSFHPVLIDEDLRPEVLGPSDPRFADELAYLDWASEGFTHNFTVRGNEVVVA